MAFIGIRDLSQRLSKVLSDLHDSEEPVIITKQGRPIAALVPVDQERLEDLVLAASPAAAQRRAQADQDLGAGRAMRLADLADDEEADAEAMYQAIPFSFAEAVANDLTPEFVEIARTCVGDVVGSVVSAIGPDDAEEATVTKRVQELNAGLFTRLWKHALHEQLSVREEQRKSEGVEVVQITAADATEQLRMINEPLLAAPGMSVDLYEATFSSIAQFDELAHAHEETEEEISNTAAA